jgi:hypothetical protein
MQRGRTREWVAISADYRNYMELGFDYVTYCRTGYITFCDFREAILDRSFESCVGGLFFGKPEVAVRCCERLIIGRNFEPRMVRVRANPPVWLYSVNGIVNFETRCAIGSRGLRVQITKTGLLRQPNGCDLVNEYMMLKASRTYGSHYQIEYAQIMIRKMEGPFTAHELKLLQEDPKGTKATLDRLD